MKHHEQKSKEGESAANERAGRSHVGTGAFARPGLGESPASPAQLSPQTKKRTRQFLRARPSRKSTTKSAQHSPCAHPPPEPEP